MRHKWMYDQSRQQSKHNKVCSVCGCQKVFGNDGRLREYNLNGIFSVKAPECKKSNQ